MSRGHLPYGYRIENGAAVINEKEAEQIRGMYKGYLDGLSLVRAAKAVGLELGHSSAKHLLWNAHYPGDDFYPAIIDQETFDAFEAERKRREEALGRDKKEKKTVDARPAPTIFRMGSPTQTFANPYRQAQYIYSLIESEV